MMTEQDLSGEREQVELLLPWYVTGRLDAKETARVEAYLQSHPELLRQLEIAQEDRHEVVRANEARSMAAPRLVLDDLLGKIRKGGASPQASHRGTLEWLGSWLEALLPREKWAAALAAFLLITQALTLAMLIHARSDGGYRIASDSPALSADGAFAVVRFTDGAMLGAIGDLLRQSGITVIDGPKAGGLYVLRLGRAGMSEDDRKQRISDLLTHKDLVIFAAPAK